MLAMEFKPGVDALAILQRIDLVIMYDFKLFDHSHSALSADLRTKKKPFKKEGLFIDFGVLKILKALVLKWKLLTL